MKQVREVPNLIPENQKRLWDSGSESESELWDSVSSKTESEVLVTLALE